MANIATMQIVGRAARDAELKYTPSGTAVCEFCLAVNTGWGDNQETLWQNCTAFSKRAEFCQKYITKGSNVAVTGSIRVERWDKRDGSGKGERTILIADNVQVIGGENRQQPTASQQQPQPQPLQPAFDNSAANDETQDQIPF